MFSTDCINEVIRNQNIVDENQTYFIGDPALVLKPTWTSNVETFACPFTYKIYQKVVSSWVNPLVETEAVLEFPDLNDAFSIESSNYSLHGEIWVIRLTRESEYSEVTQTSDGGRFGI